MTKKTKKPKQINSKLTSHLIPETIQQKVPGHWEVVVQFANGRKVSPFGIIERDGKYRYSNDFYDAAYATPEDAMEHAKLIVASGEYFDFLKNEWHGKRQGRAETIH